ncbi:MAG: phage tail sheath family protein, partial [bacterium]|nr:phage tail sheath family protein [bacterium]
MEEVASGVQPIAAAGTSTAAFVGITEKGTVDKAKLITNWTEFQRNYGSFISSGYLPQCVFQFFNNGGNQCYIVRAASSPVTADVTVLNREATPAAGLKFEAKNEGTWGNKLWLQFEDGSKDAANDGGGTA